MFLIIRLYWIFIPKKLRSCCLYKESCSNYVYRRTAEDGANAGIEAIKVRFKNCRSGYTIKNSVDSQMIITKQGQIIKWDSVSPKFKE